MTEESEKRGKLVIVESPAKARTLGRFLGRGYAVKASLGHVRDLLRSRLSVDVDNDFRPTYRVPNEKRKVVKELQEAVRQAMEIYLATDPDREGEAIAWHLIEAAEMQGIPIHRVVFHEITKEAVLKAFSHPREIDMQLVNSQQARRILDRLVGYPLGRLLWKRVKGGLSAGRVQSVALRLVVEREREIEAFVPEEYWTIEAELAKEERSFRAKLQRVQGKEPELESEEDTQRIVDDLEGASYIVSQIRRKDKYRHPPAPFTTSTLQQEAWRQLRFRAARTMRIAQQLYEGVAIGDGDEVGLITYMRTDSVNVSPPARAEAREYVSDRYGPNYLPAKSRRYKTRAKIAQEAHEAIRPTSVWREPNKLRPYLSRAQDRLYELIWKRFLASQMASAVLDIISIEIKAGDPQGEMSYLFTAAGHTVKFPGFLILYSKREDKVDDGVETLLSLKVRDVLRLVDLFPEQHFTQPPPRYTEATLIRELERNGIGRPSTYAPILSTIQARGYVERAERSLRSTELGSIVNDLLVKYFPAVVDMDFTAEMEENLDRIAAGERGWVETLDEFYGPFAKALELAEREMQKVELDQELTGELCEKCGSPMVIKQGRFGKFVSCSNYPACRNTRPYLVRVGVTCPECGGDVVEKRSRRGRLFYGCSNYPECKFATWNRPLTQPCPYCDGLMTVVNGGRAKCTKCGEVMAIEELEEVGERQK